MLTAEWKIKGIYDANPNDVVNEIESIGDKPSTKQIVDKARKESSCMHKVFEWNDGIAGEKYREIQAKDMVRMLVVKREEKKEEDAPIRYFVSTGDRNGTYNPIHLVMKNDDSYKKMLFDAWNELRVFKNKYSTLQELNEIFALID